MVTGALVTAACSGGSEAPDATEVADATDATEVTTTQPDPAFTEASTTAPEERVPVEDGPLGGVCPATVVVQLDDLPSVEHGGLFRLLGADATIDDATQSVRAPLTRVDGTVEDVVLEIRSGGPAIRFVPALDAMETDPSITLTEASTPDVLLATERLETLSVVSLTARSHLGLLWDPATYPDVTGIEDLAANGVEIHHSPGEPFIEFLEATGPLTGAVTVDDYLGEPASFVAAAGRQAQQADGLVDPFLFPSLPQWARPVEFAGAADAGWASADDALVVRADQVADLDVCLGRLVPLVQEATIDYARSPQATNVVTAGLRQRFNELTRSRPDLLDAGARAAVERGVFANGPDGALGSFDVERLDRFLPQLSEVLGVDPVRTATDIVTNDYVRPGLGL